MNELSRLDAGSMPAVLENWVESRRVLQAYRFVRKKNIQIKQCGTFLQRWRNVFCTENIKMQRNWGSILARIRKIEVRSSDKYEKKEN